jgi:RNA polymerase sigma factor (sigma-70 family)
VPDASSAAGAFSAAASPADTAHVMDPEPGRSTGMEDALVMPLRTGEQNPRRAFEALYRSSRDDVYAYVVALLRDGPAAEDVTATAFERAYRKRSSFQARRGSARAWLFGIARNAALDELRRRQRSAVLLGDPTDPTDQQTEGLHGALEGGLGDDERRLSLREALQALAPRERELIALKFHAGLTNSEIARVVGTSETNAGTLLHRTITKLREACNATV